MLCEEIVVPDARTQPAWEQEHGMGRVLRSLLVDDPARVFATG
jgi:hypothetical protein